MTSPIPTPGDIYVAAATADHHTHCTDCRERTEQADARSAAYGDSIRRRDRLTIGLPRLPSRSAVTA